jgi:tetratricopeptide (TPR) repeat protein
MFQQAGGLYSEALRLNPLDAETAYKMGKAEEQLESVYQQIYPHKKDDTPYHPLPYFQEAVRLRPNGISHNYTLARYQYKKGDEKGLHETVRQLVRMYPNVYYHLKKEAFWSPAVRDACKQGLEEAIKEKYSLREAHLILSTLMAEEEAWRSAISHYKHALREKSFQNTSVNYVVLGNLYLKDGQFKNAKICFFHGVKISQFRERELARIYMFYRNEHHAEEFCKFYQEVARHFILPYKTDIFFARGLADLKKYQESRDVLNQLNEKSPDAEAYYWLSRVAELEQDWDAMELAIQKATVLDPDNRTYHQVFANVLRRLKKYDRANEEAQKSAR